MSAQAAPARYSIAAIILHWTLAALLLFQLSLGWRMEELAGLSQFAAYQLHKTVGITILLLSLARLAIRIFVPRPATLKTSPALAALAGAVHALLYVVMIGGPITGWIIVSTAPIKVQTLLFGLIPWPHLPLGEGWHDPANAVHGLLGWLFAGLVVLHVAGALRHHILHDDILGRMVPRVWGARSALHAVAVVAVLGAVAAFSVARLLPFGGAAATEQAVAVPQPAPELALADNAIAEMAPQQNAATAGAEAGGEEEAVATAQAEEDEEESAAAQPEKAMPWQVQSGGRLGFRTEYSGSAIEGGFARWDADIVFSPEDLPGSRISVTVDLASVDSADSQRDDMLRGGDFFETATYPRATFRSSRITHRGDNAYRAAGTLSLHGQQKPVTLDFTLDIEDAKARATGSAQLSRTAFGVGTGQWASTDTIADGVTVTFDFTAQRED